MKYIVIGLGYWTVTYIKKTLESFQPHNVDFVLLENKSPYSPQIKEMVDDLKWDAYFRHVTYDPNIIGEVFRVFYNDNKDFLKQYDYVVTVEMDISFDAKFWNDMVTLMKTGKVVSGAMSSHNLARGWNKNLLKTTTLGTIDGTAWGYSPKLTGFQCQAYMYDVFSYFMNTSYPIIDSNVPNILKECGVERISPSESTLTHLMWDAYLGKDREHEDIATYLKNKNLTLDNRQWDKRELSKGVQVVSDRDNRQGLHKTD